ncbi:MAG: amidohydrolase family protein [Anaerolineales bacterium]|nr:amidohydrolase family protein [Anaerolineales bacterium]
MTPPAPLLDSLPGLVNAHTHSPYGPYCRGLTRSAPFEVWMADIMARETRPLTPAEVEAGALLTGLENLAAGNTALMDQHFGPQDREALHRAAQAYEDLGLRAWIFVTLSDLPYLAYTREAYPRFPGAIAERDLPDDLVEFQRPALSAEEQLARAAEIIRGWRGQRVQIGLGLSNPVWCSDALLRGAAELARQLQAPLAIHAEEAPLQRVVARAQWGLTGIGRLAAHGLLSDRTLLAHVVQVDAADIHLLAQHRVSISHNPISNLKLQAGIAPLGRLVRAGVNVCLGSDGHASGDSQNLYTVMKFVVALGGLNGLRDLTDEPERLALRLAVDHGRRLWFAGDPARDYVTFTEPLGPYAPVWDEPAGLIAEVYVDGKPRLAAARARVAAAGARPIMLALRAAAAGTERLDRAARWAAALRGQALAR